MNIDFNNWWDEDVLTEENPFNGGTPAYWAWEGWCAGVKAEREACAKVCDAADKSMHPADLANAIRARGNT